MLASLMITTALLQAIPVAPSCDHDRTRMVAMTPAAFDQDPTGGWRAVSAREGCKGVAADLIAAHREAQRAVMSSEELHASYWHEGQLRADTGDIDQAVRLLMAGVRPEREADGFEEYALGTIAFLRRDRRALQVARDRLAALPPSESWPTARADFKARYGVELTWPLNLDVLDGLLNCFDRPYSEAYGAECRTSGGG